MNQPAQRIKVVHIVTRMNVGGVAVLIDNLLSNIDQARFEPILITGYCQDPEANYLEEQVTNYKVIQLPTLAKSTSLIDTFKSFLGMRRILRELHPDVVHTHTSKAGVLGRVAAFTTSTKLASVHTYHGHLLVGYFSRVKVALIVFIEKCMGLISTRLIAMGNVVKDDLVAAKVASASKFEVLYPGIKQPKFPDYASARSDLGFNNEKIYCVYIGRLTSIKRPERIIQVSEILVSHSEISFIVVGDGDLGVQLRQEVMTKELPVSFLGWRNDIPEILAACDIGLLTSDNEAVALTLIESALAGLPLVTTAAGSVRDIAIDGFNAIVTDFSGEELASAILKLSNDPELRRTLGKNGREFAQKRFAISTMVEAHERLYNSILV